MRKALTSFVMFVVLSTCGYAVQVDGYCYLENQTNHEGTKVLFQADSPSAVTDSTYTDSTGYYQIDLSAGAYDVYFTHQGYFSDEILDQLFFAPTTLPDIILNELPRFDGYCFLQNQTNHEGTRVLFQAAGGGAVTDSVFTLVSGYYQKYLISGIYDIYFYNEGYYDYEILNQSLIAYTTLPDVTLAQIPVGVEISGELSGVLVDTTYLIIGDIWVSRGDSLTIEAGAELIFNDGVQFDIDGYLHAAGTETDSIKFINRPDLTWGGINFNDSSDDSSRLEYCLITGGYASGSWPNCNGGGILCNYSSPAISNCTISGNSAEYYGGGISCYINSNPVISNCTISGNSADYNGGGISCYDSSPIISNCNISGNSTDCVGGGIYCRFYSSPTIENCTISRNSSGGKGGGISCYYSSPTISNCTISGNSANDWGGGISCSISSPTILNCTISGNSSGVSGGGIWCYNSSSNIVNAIIEGNTGNGGIYFNNSPDASITYGDFYDNEGGSFTGSPPTYLGQIVTVNANGDSCDAYYNIFEDPLFYSTTGDSAFYLTANSPCIDAGDPASPLDPDSTIADIGAFYFHQGYIPPEPDIAISEDELDFGLVPVGNYEDLPLTIYSTGDTTLVIQGIFTSEDAFYTDFDPADSLIEPGDSLELTVTFEPLIEMMYDETLFIVSNAEEDTVTVSLLGDGGAVPDSVENLVITLEYPDAVLTWEAVTTSVSGYPIQVDYYLIFFETDAYDEFEFLAYTVATTYTHSGVVQFAESQFYFVEAYCGEIGVLEAIVAAGATLNRQELYDLLK